MRNPLSAPLFTIIHAEILYNGKRIATWVLIGLFSLNAITWWSSAAIHFGWAPNSDFYIVRLFSGFAFMTAPFFTAMFMGSAVNRDFRYEIGPLLLSAPISRAEYLLGKFFGNFLSLTACFASFAVTLFLLQWEEKEGLVLLPWRLIPFIKHFLMFLVIPHLAVAAFCFMVGTLSRSAKLVYGLVTALYGLYISVMATLEFYAPKLTVPLDPFLIDWISRIGRRTKPDVVNQMVIHFDLDLWTNRAVMFGFAMVFLAILYFRFSIEERRHKKPSSTLLLSLREPAELIHLSDDFLSNRLLLPPLGKLDQSTPLPTVAVVNQGFHARWTQFVAAVGAEFRLLRNERSLIAIAPLMVFLCSLQLSPFGRAPVASVYAINSAYALLLVLLGITLFYTGEMMHRDRECRIEPLLWGAPTPNWIILLSKFTSMLLLALSLVTAVALTAIALQFYRDSASVEIKPYFIVYTIILLPSLVFIIGAVIALHVFLREKYLAHAIGLAIGGGAIYSLLQGHTNPLHNPTLYARWAYPDLLGLEPFRNGIILQRVYWLAITVAAIATADRFYQRLAARTWRTTATIAIPAILIAIIAGLYLEH